MGWWFGGSVDIEQLCWRILEKKQYSQFPPVHDFGSQDEAWPMYHVWPISERLILGWFGGTWPAYCHWLNTGTVGGRCPIKFALIQSYPCDTWFSSSTLRELAVSNLGQLLFCRSITWSRSHNAYRDLWIMTIEWSLGKCIVPFTLNLSIAGHNCGSPAQHISLWLLCRFGRSLCQAGLPKGCKLLCLLIPGYRSQHGNETGSVHRESGIILLWNETLTVLIFND